MITIALVVILAFFGAVFGSFAGAQVWRLRHRQLEFDKKHGEPYDKKEYARLRKLKATSLRTDRSRCLHCGYELRWYDLIPVISWLSLKGRCRVCREKIGRFELVVELATVGYFVALFLFWPLGLSSPLEIAHFGFWLVAGVIFAVQVAYDIKWYLLPDSYSIALAVVGAVVAGITLAGSATPVDTAWSIFGAVMAIAGLYGLLYVVSSGRWVGLGDVKLGVGLGLMLADWRLALLAVFIANLIGTIIVMPLLAMGRMSRTSHVPFGPMLIMGTILAWLFGGMILGWYVSNLGLY